jgi:hypothetical protein
MGRTLLLKYSFVINYNYIIIIEKTKRVDATTISKYQRVKTLRIAIVTYFFFLIT